MIKCRGCSAFQVEIECENRFTFNISLKFGQSNWIYHYACSPEEFNWNIWNMRGRRVQFCAPRMDGWILLITGDNGWSYQSKVVSELLGNIFACWLFFSKSRHVLRLLQHPPAASLNIQNVARQSISTRALQTKSLEMGKPVTFLHLFTNFSVIFSSAETVSNLCLSLSTKQNSGKKHKGLVWFFNLSSHSALLATASYAVSTKCNCLETSFSGKSHQPPYRLIMNEAFQWFYEAHSPPYFLQSVSSSVTRNERTQENCYTLSNLGNRIPS